VQATFRDIVSGGTDLYQATPGWDYPTGWGAPRALQLAEALP
jgi:kumamolisin